MRIDMEDDSTGKRKMGALRHRSALLTGALLVGVCLGVIVSEKLYLVTQEAELPEGALAAVRSRKLEVAGDGGAVALATAGGGVSGGPDAIARSADRQPRNELEALLRQVAPQGEVMIAIRWVPAAAGRTHSHQPAGHATCTLRTACTCQTSNWPGWLTVASGSVHGVQQNFPASLALPARLSCAAT